MSKKVGEILVKRYTNERQFERDARELAKRGYVVTDVATRQPRNGLMRIILLGFFALLFKPKSQIIVTYRLNTAHEGSA